MTARIGRLVGICTLGGATLVALAGTHTFSAQAEEVCTRYVCQPAGATAPVPTPDGTRPPEVTQPPSTVVVTREPTPAGTPQITLVKTREGVCYPAGGTDPVDCP